MQPLGPIMQPLGLLVTFYNLQPSGCKIGPLGSIKPTIPA